MHFQQMVRQRIRVFGFWVFPKIDRLRISRRFRLQIDVPEIVAFGQPLPVKGFAAGRPPGQKKQRR
jgi:hypothetical protein